MRPALCCVLAFLSGCGYVGDPLPPALHIPKPVTDLTVRQIGAELRIGFTVPSTTTEDLKLDKAAIDLRIGVSQAPFEMNAWAASIPPILYEAREPGAAELRLPVEKYAGRDNVIAVRLQSTRGRYSAWSAPVSMRVLPPVEPPAKVRADLHPEGIRVTWQPAPDTEWLIFAQAPGDKEFQQVGTASMPEFVHRTAGYGKPVSYRIQARRQSALSELSPAISISPEDKFAPASPKGLTAIAGINSIELAWERNTEPDLKGYRLYRALEAAAFEAVSELTETPAFSDRKIESGKRYRYRITAADQAGNESQPSPVVEITAP